ALLSNCVTLSSKFPRRKSMRGRAGGLSSFNCRPLFAARTPVAPRAAYAFAVTLALALVVGVAPPASGQHRRARLSADLAHAIVTGSRAIDVIVHGDRATVDAAARRYNLKVNRYLRNGAVIRMNAGQLAAFQDDGFDHLSSDVRIYAADVTTDTI